MGRRQGKRAVGLVAPVIDCAMAHLVALSREMVSLGSTTGALSL